jgi:hypothetical protein
LFKQYMSLPDKTRLLASHAPSGWAVETIQQVPRVVFPAINRSRFERRAGRRVGVTPGLAERVARFVLTDSDSFGTVAGN